VPDTYDLLRKQMNVTSNFIDDEDIISKLQYIEHMESRWPYPQSQGIKYFERILNALNTVPANFHEPALALFANVVYLPEPILKDTWPYLLSESAEANGVSENDMLESAHFFEVDTGGIVYDFINKLGIQGRLDTDQFPRIYTIDDLIGQLHWLVSAEEKKINEGLKQDIKNILNKRFWFFLVDNSLSGTSLCSELERSAILLRVLREKFQVPTVVPLVQVFTQDAENNIRKRADSFGDVIKPPTYALYFDSSFKISPETREQCQLFSNEATVSRVIDFCKWFAAETEFASDPELEMTKQKSQDNLEFGFKCGGWTLVTPNCPTNSLPPLWYFKLNHYVGPFVRISSRTTQTKGHGQERLRAVLERGDELLNKL